MPLYDAATSPHTVTVYAPTVTRDGGGGTGTAFTTVRTSGVKGYLNAVSASEREIFSQMGLVVSHQFSTTDTTAQRGDKLTYGSRSFHIVGIQQSEAVGTIPVLNRILLEEQLG